MTRVFVGPSQTEFLVHTKIICEISPFFRTAIQGTGDGTERQHNLITLAEDKPTTFEHFLHWMYTSTIVTTPEEDGDGLADKVDSLVQLYVLANKLQVSACKVDIVRLLWRDIEKVKTVSVDSCILLSTHTTLGDALWELIMDWYAIKSTKADRSLELFERVPAFAHSIHQESMRRVIREDKARPEWKFQPSKWYEDLVSDPRVLR